MVTAHDDQSLGKTATATMTIDVIHNPNAPRLTSSKFETTIFEYLPLSSNILNVTANDLDAGVCISLNEEYSLI